MSKKKARGNVNSGSDAFVSIFGILAGTVNVAEGTDLTAPVWGEAWDGDDVATESDPGSAD